MNSTAKLSLAVLIATALSACGGGGGGSSTAATSPAIPPTAPTVPTVPTVPTAPTVTPADLQTQVPAPTYAEGSEELKYFNTFNKFRADLGLGLLAQNTKLDLADQNHLKYLMSNTDVNTSEIDPKTGRPRFHIEDPLRPNFTGIQEIDRAAFTQYKGSYVGEEGTYGAGGGATLAFESLLHTVYHRAGLMFQSPREFGIAIGTDRLQTTVATFGFQETGQRNASDYFGVYPAANQTGIPLQAYEETPSPFPDVVGSDWVTKTGFPINVMCVENRQLTVETFTVTENGQSSPMPARLVTKDNDLNKWMPAHIAFLVAKISFKPNTVYNVNFVGTANGAKVTKSWSFTTGAK